MTNTNRPDGVGTVNLLWTGGWDSTFRLLSLITAHRCSVQPYYVIDRGRRSWPVELATIDRILTTCRDAGAGRIGAVLDPIIVDKEDFHEDEEIRRCYRALRRHGYLGDQYLWLAHFAKQRNLSDLELSIHRDDIAHGFLRGHVERHDGAFGATYALRPGVNDGLTIFRFFQFPLFDLRKTDMKVLAKQGGFHDILTMTWFCYSPLKGGRPCGTCNPCRFTIGEGLARRVGWPGRARYYCTMGPVRRLMPGGVRATASRFVPEGAKRALKRVLRRPAGGAEAGEDAPGR